MFTYHSNISATFIYYCNICYYRKDIPEFEVSQLLTGKRIYRSYETLLYQLVISSSTCWTALKKDRYMLSFCLILRYLSSEGSWNLRRLRRGMERIYFFADRAHRWCFVGTKNHLWEWTMIRSQRQILSFPRTVIRRNGRLFVPTDNCPFPWIIVRSHGQLFFRTVFDKIHFVHAPSRAL